MLSEKKEFSDDYCLNEDTFFEELKKLARFPKIKIVLLFLIPTLVLIIVFCAAIYFICPQTPIGNFVPSTQAWHIIVVLDTDGDIMNIY